ncbi:MAG TPA: hypothetical protein VHD84_01400 [Candidatus Saccharimonadales bacterium]|nr:hypothetical protein [Candidatus Saccharimonadales bacterium]
MRSNHEKSGERRISPRWWDRQEDLAKSFMETREASGAVGTLIAIAGQHPSIEGIYPNEEYRIRLDTAIELAQGIAVGGGKADFATLSSRLIDEDTKIADKVALADAGAAYLISQGINPQNTHSEWNERYKGDEGVYTGGDEAFVVARAFQDNPEYRDLIFVLSPGQMGRARLNFTANGVYPKLRFPEAIDTVTQHHSNWLKNTGYIIYTRLLDPDWQGSSRMGAYARKLRMPSDGVGSQIPFEQLVELYKQRYPLPN